MKGIFYSAFFICLFNVACSQNPTTTTISNNQLLKWNKAIINFGGYPDNGKVKSALWEMFFNQRISKRQYDSLSKIADFPTFQMGTAIYLFYNNLHFLLTCRHVLEDETSTARTHIYAHTVLLENAAGLENQRMIDTAHELYASNEINLLHILDDSSYDWTDTTTDLGIICLEKVRNYGKEFIELLKKRKYEPIEMKDIDTLTHIAGGDPIFALGFPRDISWVRKENAVPQFFWIEPDIKSIAVLTKGVVVSAPSNKPYFEAGISIDHGNSGGPVIKNNKLVGIVHGWNAGVINLPAVTLNAVMEWTPRMTKSSEILPFIRAYLKRKY